MRGVLSGIWVLLIGFSLHSRGIGEASSSSSPSTTIYDRDFSADPLRLQFLNSPFSSIFYLDSVSSFLRVSGLFYNFSNPDNPLSLSPPISILPATVPTNAGSSSDSDNGDLNSILAKVVYRTESDDASISDSKRAENLLFQKITRYGHSTQLIPLRSVDVNNGIVAKLAIIGGVQFLHDITANDSSLNLDDGVLIVSNSEKANWTKDYLAVNRSLDIWLVDIYRKESLLNSTDNDSSFGSFTNNTGDVEFEVYYEVDVNLITPNDKFTFSPTGEYNLASSIKNDASRPCQRKFFSCFVNTTYTSTEVEIHVMGGIALNQTDSVTNSDLNNRMKYIVLSDHWKFSLYAQQWTKVSGSAGGIGGHFNMVSQQFTGNSPKLNRYESQVIKRYFSLIGGYTLQYDVVKIEATAHKPQVNTSADSLTMRTSDSTSVETMTYPRFMQRSSNEAYIYDPIDTLWRTVDLTKDQDDQNTDISSVDWMGMVPTEDLFLVILGVDRSMNRADMASSSIGAYSDSVADAFGPSAIDTIGYISIQEPAQGICTLEQDICSVFTARDIFTVLYPIRTVEASCWAEDMNSIGKPLYGFGMHMHLPLVDDTETGDDVLDMEADDILSEPLNSSIVLEYINNHQSGYAELLKFLFFGQHLDILSAVENGIFTKSDTDLSANDIQFYDLTDTQLSQIQIRLLYKNWYFDTFLYQDTPLLDPAVFLPSLGAVLGIVCISFLSGMCVCSNRFCGCLQRLFSSIDVEDSIMFSNENGTRKEVIDQLQTRKVTPELAGSFCAICLGTFVVEHEYVKTNRSWRDVCLCKIDHVNRLTQEEMEGVKKVVQLPCTHCFCKECIEAWLFLHRTCPVCKDNVEEHMAQDSLHEQDELLHQVPRNELDITKESLDPSTVDMLSNTELPIPQASEVDSNPHATNIVPT